MNGAEDDEAAARSDAGGIHRRDGRGGFDFDNESAASPEAFDPRVVGRRRDERQGERSDAEADDEKTPRTGREKRNGEKVREEVDGDASQADHQASLAGVLPRLTSPLRASMIRGEAKANVLVVSPAV